MDDTEHSPRGLGTSVVVAMPDEIDLSNAAQVGTQLSEAFTPGITTVIADMTATMFCDSSGMRELILLHRHAAENDAELWLVTSSAALLRVFTVTALDELIPIYPSLDSALSACSGRGA